MIIPKIVGSMVLGTLRVPLLGQEGYSARVMYFSMSGTTRCLPRARCHS